MKKLVGLDMPSVLGMGISGPVLAFLTATMYAAFKEVFEWNDCAYAIIMLFLSGLLAVFPVMKSEYQKWMKVVVWPIATVMIFASAWGSSTGMSAGEEMLTVTNKMAMQPRLAGECQEETLFMMVEDIDIDESQRLQGGFFKRMN